MHYAKHEVKSYAVPSECILILRVVPNYNNILCIYLSQTKQYWYYLVNTLVNNPWKVARRKGLKIVHQAPLHMCLAVFCLPDVLPIWLSFFQAILFAYCMQSKKVVKALEYEYLPHRSAQYTQWSPTSKYKTVGRQPFSRNVNSPSH